MAPTSSVVPPAFLFIDDEHKPFLILAATLSLAAASFVLCALWGNYDYPGFLGVPGTTLSSWENNLISWHTILLVCGFFFAQVLALTTTGIFPASRHTQLHGVAFWYHLFWQLAAAATMIAGNLAAFRYYNNLKLPNLTSVHSWYGVATAVAFALNFLVVLVSAFVSEVYESLWFKGLRMCSRVAAFVLTVVSIATGIMLWQGETGCFYEHTSLPLPVPDTNPSLHYTDLPNGCKLSNGLGITVTACGLCTLGFLALRYQSWSDMVGRRLFLAGMDAHKEGISGGHGSDYMYGEAWNVKVAEMFRNAQLGLVEGGEDKDKDEAKEGEEGTKRVAQASGGGLLI